MSRPVISEATQRCECTVLSNIRRGLCAIEARLVTSLHIAGHMASQCSGRFQHMVSPLAVSRGFGVQVGHWVLFAKGSGTGRDGTGWCFVSVGQACMVCDVHTGLVAFTMVV